MTANRSNYIPVFISSTFDDLIPHREAVQKVLVRLETIVKGMEYFGSRPGSPKEECLNVVRESSVFILVVAMKYGCLDPESGKSMVQLEYEEAQRKGIPTLAYLLNDKIQPVLPAHIDLGEKADKLESFKELLKNKHTVSFFTSPEDLSLKVAQDLPRQFEFVGISLPSELRQNLIKERDSAAILRTFRIRPGKVVGQEVAVTIQFPTNSELYSAGPSDCSRHKIPFGDAFRLYTECFVDKVSYGRFSVYAFGESGDWIESNISKLEQFDAIVQLGWGVRDTYYKLAGVNKAEKVEEEMKALIIKEILLT